jgi:O-succinylbenzoic acid--CoA ligase
VTLSVFDAARDAPDREALVCDGVRLTFAALATRVAARLAALLALGVEPASERPLALIVDGSLGMFEHLYALLALGVPVLPLHPRLTAPERAALLAASTAPSLIDPAQSEPARAETVQIPNLRPVPAERALALVPSSGTSGTPKLVVLSRRAFSALARADALRVPPLPSDRALLCLPLSHVGGLSVVVRSLIARRTCVAFRPPRGGLMHAASELRQTLDVERISLLSLVPPVLARLLGDSPSFGERGSLRAVLIGGQACAPELFDEARARGIPALTSYGLTEMCSQVATLAFPPPQRAAVHHGVVSSGLPLPGVEVRIRGGLIEVRGPSAFSGYLGAPAALDEDGFFPTGDRGELDPELGLFVFGRQSELVISGGENIDPTEVEHALLACGGLEAVCVFGIPDPLFGECVVAALEPKTGAVLDEGALFAELGQRLASFKQPRRVCVFDELPRLGSGKLDRRRIRAEATPRLRAPHRA